MSKKLSQHKCYQWKIPSDFIEINFVIDTKAKNFWFCIPFADLLRNVISAEVFNNHPLFGLAVIVCTLSFLFIRCFTIFSFR